MCSGCSGDYAGGFDSDDLDDPIAEAGDDTTSASFDGETGLAEVIGGGPAGLEVPEGASESCEILVTGTQIIEIRVISVNSHGQDRLGDRLGKMRSTRVPHRSDKHSSGVSAKHYPTLQGGEKSRAHGARSERISRSFAGFCKARLMGWLRETLRLAGTGAPRSG